MSSDDIRSYHNLKEGKTMNDKKYGPVEGCDDCAWYTDAFEQPTACPECEADQREEKGHDPRCSL